MKKLFFAYIVAVLCVGCATPKPHERVQHQQLPKWYIKPPVSTATTLYGIGEGRDRHEAIADALAYLASTLSVSVGSSYSTKTTLHNDKLDTIYRSNIETKVIPLRIGNYQVLQEQKLGFEHYAVLIASDKAHLFSNLLTELQYKIQLYKAKQKTMRNSEPLQQYVFYQQAKKHLASLPNILVVMQELDHRFDPKEFLKVLDDIERHLALSKKKTTFVISSDVPGLDVAVAKALGKQGFGVKNTAYYQVEIHSSIKKVQAYGFVLARAQIKIVTKNRYKDRVASNVVHIVGQSSQSYSVALQDLVRKFDEKLEKDGVAKLLNLPI